MAFQKCGKTLHRFPTGDSLPGCDPHLFWQVGLFQKHQSSQICIFNGIYPPWNQQASFLSWCLGPMITDSFWKIQKPYNFRGEHLLLVSWSPTSFFPYSLSQGIPSNWPAYPNPPPSPANLKGHLPSQRGRRSRRSRGRFPVGQQVITTQWRTRLHPRFPNSGEKTHSFWMVRKKPCK